MRAAPIKFALLTVAALACRGCIPAVPLSGFGSDFPAIIPLSSLNGANGFRLDGPSANGRAGYQVADAGDFNGDRISDLIIGAPFASPAGKSGAGSSYLVFGRRNSLPAVTNLAALNGSNGFRIDGGSGDQSGTALSAAGDFNGDGFADLLIGANAASPEGRSNAGSAYIVFGRAGVFPAVFDLTTINGTNGFRLDGVIAGGNLGGSLDSAGDINRDGFADVAIGALNADPERRTDAGSTYVVFGKASGFPAAFSLASLNGSNGFRVDGSAASDKSGFALAGAGDVNGDRFADLIIGAPFSKPGGRSGAGSAYIVFGKASGFAPGLNLANLNGSNGFRMLGAAPDDSAGQSVGGGGDVNGDGFTDVIIGAPGADGAAGSTYVVFGKADAFPAEQNLSTIDGSNGFRLDGQSPDDKSGWSVANAGDVNRDGFADVITGAPSRPSIAEAAGSSYVVPGMASGFAANTDLSTLDGANGFRLDGVAAFDNSGLSVMSMDINGDGVTDVIIGAPGTDIHGPLSGSVYVVFGHAPTAAVTRFGSHAGQDMSGGAFEDTLLGLVGSDTLEGRGNGDGLIGGPGDDTASYAHASAGVVANLAEPGLNIGAAAGDSYDSIESITGSRFADTLVGDSYSNTLSGLSGGDSLDGDRGSDRLIGGRGADTLKGGPGRDTFVLVATADSPKGRGRDKIVDFDAGTAASVVDRIDLHKIDARTNIPGNQAFTFIGTAAFTRVSGQLRAQQSGSTTIISGDVNGDAVADFEIALVPFTNLAGIGRREFIP